jgi:hypothetical protein
MENKQEKEHLQFPDCNNGGTVSASVFQEATNFISAVDKESLFWIWGKNFRFEIPRPSIGNFLI